MFQILFKYPRVLAHHCEGPAADERQRFLIHRAKEDATRGTLLGIARELLVIAKHIDVATDKAISIDDLEAPSSVCSRRKPLWIGIAFAQKRRRP